MNVEWPNPTKATIDAYFDLYADLSTVFEDIVESAIDGEDVNTFIRRGDEDYTVEFRVRTDQRAAPGIEDRAEEFADKFVNADVLENVSFVSISFLQEPDDDRTVLSSFEFRFVFK